MNIKAIISAVIFGLLNTAVAQNSPVILELFTSQGCSSCPAADKILGELSAKAKADGKQVYALSFHVDYWNYIGWKDPYSSKEFTERQRAYAQSMNLQSIYTPQMIVNGKEEFVGSSKSQAERAIASAINSKLLNQIKITDVEKESGRIKLHYTLDKNANGESLNIALVEPEVENFVPHGENSGKRLHHNNVVRYFKVVPLQREGELEVTLPASSSALSVILYIQNKELECMGATLKALAL